MGKRLAKKLGIALQTGEHELSIEFDNQENNVIWSRCFHRQGKVLAIFRAFGNILLATGLKNGTEPAKTYCQYC